MIASLLESAMGYVFRLVCLLILSVIGVLYFLGETTLGLQTLIHLSTPFIPGKLQIKNINGKLFNAFSLQDISYQNKTIQVQISNLTMNWQPEFLYHQQLHINKLILTNINLHSTSSSKNNTAPFDYQQLAWLQKIIINHLILTNLHITHDQKIPLHISHIFLQKNSPNNIDIEIKTDAGNLSSKLMLAWEKTMYWSITAFGENINPSIFLATWPGNLHFELTANGIIAKNKPLAIQLKITEFAGKLRDHPCEGKVDINYLPKKLKINAAKLQVANTFMEFKGQVNAKWDLQWILNIPNLNTLLPQGSGSMISQGQMTGELLNPHLQGSLEGNRWYFGKDKSLQQLSVSIDAMFKSNATTTLDMHLKGLKIGDHQLKKLNFKIAGSTLYRHPNWATNFVISLENTPYINGKFVLPDTLTKENVGSPGTELEFAL